MAMSKTTINILVFFAAIVTLGVFVLSFKAYNDTTSGMEKEKKDGCCKHRRLMPKRSITEISQEYCSDVYCDVEAEEAATKGLEILEKEAKETLELAQKNLVKRKKQVAKALAKKEKAYEERDEAGQNIDNREGAKRFAAALKAATNAYQKSKNANKTLSNAKKAVEKEKKLVQSYTVALSELKGSDVPRTNGRRFRT